MIGRPYGYGAGVLVCVIAGVVVAEVLPDGGTGYPGINIRVT